MKRLLIIFSLMVASVFPTLFFFSNNIGEMMYDRIYWQLAIYFAAPIVIFPIARFFINSDNSAGIIVLLSILSYHFSSMMNFEWYSTIFVWLSLTALLAIIVNKWNNNKVKNILTNMFCIIFPILFIINTIPVATFFLDPKKIRESDVFVTTKNIDNNIYYIILDAYDRGDVLESFGYKVKLAKFLEGKGFYVADESNSNYPWTFMSLPSTLNMRYINSNLTGKNSSDYQYIAIKMIKDSVISRTMQRLGYKYVINAEESIWDNEYADYTFIADGYRDIGVSDNVRHAKNILDQFVYFDEIINIKEKKFVFANICCPHPTYVFRANGEIYDDATSDDLYNLDAYLGQVEFIRGKAMKLINDIQTNDPSAIIILQSDHGSPTTFAEGKWSNPTDENMEERFSIMNSFYFPDGDYSLLTEDITSVNTFRVLLTKYFGYEGGLLEDKMYWSGQFLPATFTDVTERVRKEVK